MPFPEFQPLPLTRAHAAFSHPDWLFEIKWTDCKLRLRAVILKRSERLLYCDHIDQDGEGLFRLGFDPYLPDHATWLKIRNQNYSQWVGREELFERERGSDPDFQVWDGCALACESAEM